MTDPQPQPAAAPAAAATEPAAQKPKRKHRIRMKPGRREAVRHGPKPRRKHFTELPGHKGNKAASKFDAQFVEQAEVAATYGLTNTEMAEFFHVNEKTFNTWLAKRKAFAQAVERGRLPTNMRAVSALLKKGLGYDYLETEYVVNRQTGAQVPVSIKTKHLPPDTGALMQFLKNRSNGKWSDKTSVEHTGAGGEPLQPIIIRITAEELPQAKQPIIDIPPQPQLRAPQPEPPQESAPEPKAAQSQPQAREQAVTAAIGISVTPEELPVAKEQKPGVDLDALAAAVEGLKQ
jgi:hypothetical protein